MSSPTPSPSSRATAIVSWRDFDRGADGIAQFLLDLGVGPAGQGGRSTSTTAPSTSRPASPPSRSGWSRSTRTTATATTSSATCGPTPTRWPSSSTATFAERIERIRDRVPGVQGVALGRRRQRALPRLGHPLRRGGQVGHRPRTAAPWGRSGDDLLMIYTGGTTGMPKGVMWRQDDLFVRLIAGGVRQYPLDGGIDGGARVAPRQPRAPPPCCRPARSCTAPVGSPPTPAWPRAGGSCCSSSRKYDPVELLDTVEREKVNGLVIVGDPFSRPLLGALDAQPGHWDLSSLVMIVSSGAMWSESIKTGAAGAITPACCWSTPSARRRPSAWGCPSRAPATPPPPPRSRWAPTSRCSRTTATEVTPGSDEIGVLALGGRNPLGYYKDDEKSDRTFKVIDGVRYSVPGDFAQVDADGTIHLLGRGSVCINSGGEKIFPEEVEEVLKTHEARARRGRRRHPAPDLRRGDRGRDRAGGRAPRRRGADGAARRSRDHRATSRTGWPGTRPPAGCASSTPSGGPPTARSTTGATGPSR